METGDVYQYGAYQFYELIERYANGRWHCHEHTIKRTDKWVNKSVESAFLTHLCTKIDKLPTPSNKRTTPQQEVTPSLF